MEQIKAFFISPLLHQDSEQPVETPGCYKYFLENKLFSVWQANTCFWQLKIKFQQKNSQYTVFHTVKNLP